MKKPDVLAALSALAQENRLDAYRLLVQAGPDGLPAGEVAASLGISPNVTVRRDGRSMIYAAQFDTVNSLVGYLTENCCGGADDCTPAAVACKPVRKRIKVSA